MRRNAGFYGGVLAFAALLLALLDSKALIGLLTRHALVDTDSYMRITRLRDVLEGDAWKAGRVLRDNWPYGFDMHWTMLYDLPILGVTRALMAIGAPKEPTLTLVGGLSGPVTLMLLVLGVAWTLRPAGDRAAWTGAVLTASAVPLVSYGGFGRADHHIATMVPLVWALGHGVRAQTRGWGFLRGLVIGLLLTSSLWVSVEALPAVVGVLAVLAARRLDGGPAGVLSAAALALALGVTVVLAIDPPPPGHQAAIDRLSSVFRDFAACSAAALWLADGLGAVKTPWVRIPGGVFGALGAGGLWLALHPEVFGGFETSVGAELARLIAPTIVELKPVRSLLDGVQYLGLGAAGVTAAVWALVRRREVVLTRVVTALMALAMLGLAVQHVRFSTYTALTGALVVAVVIVPWLEARPAGSVRGTVGWLALVQPMTAGMLALALSVGQPPKPPGCNPTAAVRKIPGPPAAVLSEHPVAPYLLYFTEHRAVAGPYHWNVQGLGDLYRSFLAASDTPAHRVAFERDLQWIMVCSRTGDPALASVEAPNFYDQLRTSPVSTWSWLKRVDGWPGETTGYVLWQVLPTEGP